MNFAIDFFKTADSFQENIRFNKIQELTGTQATAIREEIGELLNSDFNTIYIDASNTKHADLSGINEIIHTNYTLQKANKRLIFVYRRNSSVEKWVETTCLNKFVETAILPAFSN